MVYYFTAAVALGAPHRKVSFTVPTGNFGDIFAGYVAQRMGLPIERLVIATNVNDILVRTLTTGAYEPRDVVATTSPSMDIQVSSNFERLLFEAYGRDARRCAALMRILRPIAALRDRGRRRCREIRRASTPDAPTRRKSPPPSARRCGRPAISSIRTPRSAWRWPEKEPRDPALPMVVLSTAHAAKFPDAVEAACGRRPKLPDWLVRSERAAASASPCCRPTRKQIENSCCGLASRA